MSDYISREAAIAYIREQSEELQKAFEELGGESGIYADAYNDLAEDFHRIPAADVEPVRPMGMMRYNKIFDWQQCSVCGATINSTIYVSEDYNLDGEIHFCPNCGAKMDLEDENE